VWLGSDFAAMSTEVLRWLAAGIFISSLAQLPWGLIQAAGRPDLTAKIHVLELLVYLPALWLMVSRYGIQGAAVTWTARVALDTMLLLATAQHLLPGARFLRQLLPPAGTGLAVLLLATLPMTMLTKLVFDLAVVLALLISVGLFFVTQEERQALRTALEPVRRRFYRIQEV
jgi:O-antigen/teichoic acid export membrane protein